MKQHLLLFGLLTLLVTSCEEEASPPDDIVYFDIEPDIIIKTIRYFEYPPMGPCDTPYAVPSDSTSSYELDIDSDGEPDFSFIVHHVTRDCAGPGYCHKSTSRTVYIEPVNPNAMISLDLENIHFVRPFDSTEVISTSGIWSNNRERASWAGECGSDPFPFSKGYWGLRKDDMLGWVQVDVNFGRLTIKAFAINRTENNCIRAGQTE